MAEHTLFGAGEAASGYNGNDTDDPIILGIVFRVDAENWTSIGLRFVPTTIVNDRQAYLWKINPSGPHTLLATALVDNPTQSAWNRVEWDDPVDLDNGDLYAVGVYHEHGGYWAKQNVFASDIESPTTDSLIGPSSSAVDTIVAEAGAGNGFYWQPGVLGTPSSPGALDLGTFNNSGYLIDPIVEGAPVTAPPVNTGVPVVTGSPRIGEVLSCGTGTWSGHPTPTYARQWLRDGTNISGATGATYTVLEADLNHAISCRVTATNSQGSDQITSNAVNIFATPRTAKMYRQQSGIWEELHFASPTREVLYTLTAGAGGQAEFDTGVMDFSPFQTVRVIAKLRSDSPSIYEECITELNGDTTANHYGTQCDGGNPHTPGGTFSVARWDGYTWISGVKGAACPNGLLLGYGAGAGAQAGYFSEWTADFLRPGEAYLPKTVRSECRYIENRDEATASVPNGPEQFVVAGFYMPDTPTAINRIRLWPLFGTKFLEGSDFTVEGIY
jgi:hypothetical protein